MLIISSYLKLIQLIHRNRKNKKDKLSYLCCNTCMVTSRDPKYFVALHPFPGELQIEMLWLRLGLGILHAAYIVVEYHRTSASSTATVRAWPRCREPVTFGGGMHRENVWSTLWVKLSWTDNNIYFATPNQIMMHTVSPLHLSLWYAYICFLQQTNRILTDSGNCAFFTDELQLLVLWIL